MATPKNAPYKKAQREAKRMSRRVFVLWTSCYAKDGLKIQKQGTYVKSKHGLLKSI